MTSGSVAGAASAHAELLNGRLHVLGPDHPRTLTTRHNLARWQEEAEQQGPEPIQLGADADGGQHDEP
ncbi:hypothetical protein [Streptomyces sp. NPDC057909]|uniref:hypothetical protein n=1 Tax=Streptomyces sp. NPDC057909 TaxID=3346277 RepID=UPI0036E17B54